MKKVYTCTITLDDTEGIGQINFKDNGELNIFERIGLFEYLLTDWKIPCHGPAGRKAK